MTVEKDSEAVQTGIVAVSDSYDSGAIQIQVKIWIFNHLVAFNIDPRVHDR